MRGRLSDPTGYNFLCLLLGEGGRPRRKPVGGLLYGTMTRERRGRLMRDIVATGGACQWIRMYAGSLQVRSRLSREGMA